jgi:hypothetical protein
MKKIRLKLQRPLTIPPINASTQAVTIPNDKIVLIDDWVFNVLKNSDYYQYVDLIEEISPVITPNKKVSKLISKGSLITKHYDIAIVSENCHFYSGGRYYIWQIAHALAEAGLQVAFCTNTMPIFTNDFKQYAQFDTYLAPIDSFDIQANCYVGSPVHGNIAALKLANKYDKPVYGFVFDPLLQIKKYVPTDYEMEE